MLRGVLLARLVLLCACGLAAACTAEPPRILATTPPGDTRDTVGPYQVRLVVHGLRDSDRVQIDYSLTADPASSVALAAEPAEGRSDLRTAAIPGQPRGTRVYFHGSVLRDGEEAARDPEGSSHYTFHVRGPAGGCRADADCLPAEICAFGACRAWDGSCVATDAGLACPGGTLCDPGRQLCVIAHLACTADRDCPSIEECDRSRGRCAPRTPCTSTADCQPGWACEPDFGLCFGR